MCAIEPGARQTAQGWGLGWLFRAWFTTGFFCVYLLELI